MSAQHVSPPWHAVAGQPPSLTPPLPLLEPDPEPPLPEDEPLPLPPDEPLPEDPLPLPLPLPEDPLPLPEPEPLPEDEPLSLPSPVPLLPLEEVPLHAIQTNVDATTTAAPNENVTDVRDTMALSLARRTHL